MLMMMCFQYKYYKQYHGLWKSSVVLDDVLCRHKQWPLHHPKVNCQPPGGHNLSCECWQPSLWSKALGCTDFSLCHLLLQTPRNNHMGSWLMTRQAADGSAWNIQLRQQLALVNTHSHIQNELWGLIKYCAIFSIDRLAYRCHFFCFIYTSDFVSLSRIV